MNTPSAWSLMNDEASAWTALTYEHAKALVCAMRRSGVSESDSDLQLFIQKIGQYHRAQFEAARCLADLWAFYNAA